jgi:hypothetical protein
MKDRLCTFADSRPVVSSGPGPGGFPPARPEVLKYLKPLSRAWTAFADLRDRGFVNWAWFDELVQRGMVEGRMAPHNFTAGRPYGSRYWFRLKPERSTNHGQ